MKDLAGRFLNSSNCASVVAQQLRSEGYSEQEIEAGLNSACEERQQWASVRSVYGDPAYGRRSHAS